MDVGGAQSEARDAGEDLVGGLRPHVGLARGVRHVDERANRGLERTDARMHAAPQLLRLERGEPTLDEIEPRRVRRGEVRMEPRVPREPSPDDRGLVRPVVIHDDVDVQGGGHLGVERGQERAELHGAMPATNLAQHLPRLHVQGREERRRAVPLVVVGATLGLAGAQWQQRALVHESLSA